MPAIAGLACKSCQPLLVWLADHASHCWSGLQIMPAIAGLACRSCQPLLVWLIVTVTTVQGCGAEADSYLHHPFFPPSHRQLEMLFKGVSVLEILHCSAFSALEVI